MNPKRKKTDAALQQVREEIRKADEALVRELAGAAGESDDGWAARASVRGRIALGERVAACKFRGEPERYRVLARARDEQGLERAITDARMEEAVLERIRKQARDLDRSEALAERLADFYRDRIIPETKKVQIRRLCKCGTTSSGARVVAGVSGKAPRNGEQT